MPETPAEIIMYGTTWCFDTQRARRFFAQHNIPYRWVDIDTDTEARTLVEQINHGFRSVPTILFPDGSTLVEPTMSQLKEKFGII